SQPRHLESLAILPRKLKTRTSSWTPPKKCLLLLLQLGKDAVAAGKALLFLLPKRMNRPRSTHRGVPLDWCRKSKGTSYLCNSLVSSLSISILTNWSWTMGHMVCGLLSHRMIRNGRNCNRACFSIRTRSESVSSCLLISNDKISLIRTNHQREQSAPL